MRNALLTGAFLAMLGASAQLAAAQSHAHSASASASAPTALPTPTPALAPISAPILGLDAKPIGTITLRQGPSGVLIDLEFAAGALSPGWHGMHFHQIGTCADAGFKASGAHVGHADGIQHGLLNPMGPEAGDLPNLFVPDAGPVRAQAFTGLTRLHAAPGAPAALLDADGAAFVVHASADDQLSQPIGGAGARLACAAFLASPVN